MYAYFSKILPALLDPYSVILLLLAAAILFRKSRRLAGGLLIAAFLLLLIPSCPIVSDALLASLENQYPDAGVTGLPAGQAIVVLGGTVTAPGGRHRQSRIGGASDRLLAALRLYHAGKAPLVICSGGNHPLSAQSETAEANVMAGLLEEWGVPAGAVLTEDGSINTRENAILTRRLLKAQGIDKILLVTSGMHMPRAAAAFRKAGFEVTPAPADFQTGWAKGSLDWIPNEGSLTESALALREWIGLWVYRMRGWA